MIDLHKIDTFQYPILMNLSSYTILCDKLFVNWTLKGRCSMGKPLLDGSSHWGLTLSIPFPFIDVDVDVVNDEQNVVLIFCMLVILFSPLSLSQDRHDDHVNGNWWWPHANARFANCSRVIKCHVSMWGAISSKEIGFSHTPYICLKSWCIFKI